MKFPYDLPRAPSCQLLELDADSIFRRTLLGYDTAEPTELTGPHPEYYITRKTYPKIIISKIFT